jgi:hypothetical protein
MFFSFSLSSFVWNLFLYFLLPLLLITLTGAIQHANRRTKDRGNLLKARNQLDSDDEQVDNSQFQDAHQTGESHEEAWKEYGNSSGNSPANGERAHETADSTPPLSSFSSSRRFLLPKEIDSSFSTGKFSLHEPLNHKGQEDQGETKNKGKNEKENRKEKENTIEKSKDKEKNKEKEKNRDLTEVKRRKSGKEEREKDKEKREKSRHRRSATDSEELLTKEDKKELIIRRERNNPEWKSGSIELDSFTGDFNEFSLSQTNSLTSYTDLLSLVSHSLYHGISNSQQDSLQQLIQQEISKGTIKQFQGEILLRFLHQQEKNNENKQMEKKIEENQYKQSDQTKNSSDSLVLPAPPEAIPTADFSVDSPLFALNSELKSLLAAVSSRVSHSSHTPREQIPTDFSRIKFPNVEAQSASISSYLDSAASCDSLVSSFLASSLSDRSLMAQHLCSSIDQQRSNTAAELLKSPLPSPTLLNTELYGEFELVIVQMQRNLQEKILGQQLNDPNQTPTKTFNSSN